MCTSMEQKGEHKEAKETKKRKNPDFRKIRISRTGWTGSGRRPQNSMGGQEVPVAKISDL